MPSGKFRELKRILLSLAILSIIGSIYLYAPHRAWRAITLSISSRGATPLGIIASAVYPAYLFLPKLWKSGWPIMKDVKASLLIALGVWFAIFIYYFIWMPPETFSSAQIAEFSQHIVVEIASDDEKATGTGVWVRVSPVGFIATCISNRQSAASILNHSVNVGRLEPPFAGQLLVVPGGVLRDKGIVTYYDPNTGIEIIHVALRWRPFSVAKNLVTSKTEETRETDLVPLIGVTPRAGDQLSAAIVEDDNEAQGPLPVAASKSAYVTRLGFDTSVNRSSQRIFTSLPFKASYLGAPLLDASKTLVGLICGSDSENMTEAVPVEYLSEALNAATIPAK